MEIKLGHVIHVEDQYKELARITEDAEDRIIKLPTFKKVNSDSSFGVDFFIGTQIFDYDE